ncbi:hypothetical protein BDW74DRAFT_18500 [Aspergillus multicolor]|uniref:uncharacterized protein n=1 Tax=Aspergillus multicolor TaxID=41759 RepID=UPI003CCD382E
MLYHRIGISVSPPYSQPRPPCRHSNLILPSHRATPAPFPVSMHLPHWRPSSNAPSSFMLHAPHTVSTKCCAQPIEQPSPPIAQSAHPAFGGPGQGSTIFYPRTTTDGGE